MTGRRFEVTLIDSGARISCREDQPLLEAILSAGKGPVHCGCFGGGCGVCKVGILEGSYTVFKRMSRAHISEDEQAQDVVLACCVKPASDLVIDKSSSLAKSR